MTAPTFEQTYVNYPFAPLVGMAVWLCAYFINHDTNKTACNDLGKGMPHAA